MSFSVLTLILIYSMSNFWIFWLSMEISMILFSSLLMEKEKNSIKSILYILFQSIPSSLFLMLNIFVQKQIITSELMILLVFLLLTMKIGIYPFHWWFFNLVENLNWMSFFFFNSIVKLVPTLVFIFLMKSEISKILIFFLLVSMSLSMFSLPLKSLRMILSFSSMIHFSWIILCSILSVSYFQWYILIYFLMFIMLINVLMNFKEVYNLKEFMSSLMTKSNFLIVYILFLLFSFMGIPPLLGFLMKMFVVYGLYMNSYYLLSLLLMLISCLPMIFYWKLSLSMMMKSKNFSKNKFYLN
uniref:NADH-ubiquinone oxidoreductase chain 2 n=1 Tax=Heterodoxus macropus TaxID=145266 RepID=Q9B8G3_9NEOP|nr:NADH dehydrogenase subunit 2 [Heterodoxus macropus]